MELCSDREKGENHEIELHFCCSVSSVGTWNGFVSLCYANLTNCHCISHRHPVTPHLNTNLNAIPHCHLDTNSHSYTNTRIPARPA